MKRIEKQELKKQKKKTKGGFHRMLLYSHTINLVLPRKYIKKYNKVKD